MALAQINALLIEDNPGDGRLMHEIFSRSFDFQISLESATSLKDGLLQLAQNQFDVILLDLDLPDSRGMKTLARLQENSPTLPIVVVTGLDDENVALQAVREGAQDYLIKGQASDEVLVRSLRYSIERKRSELTLREKEERFRSVAQTAPDAIVTANSAGMITYWNNAAETLFGYTFNEIQGLPLTRLMPERFKSRHSAAFQQANQRAMPAIMPRNLEMSALRKDGSEFPVEISLASWSTEAERSFSAIIRDLTEVYQTQERVHQQDRLAAVGQLAAGIAHDFNNILGTIVLYSELVLKSETQLSENARHRLSTISRQAERGASLTNQILDFGRKSLMERRPIDVVSLLMEFERLIRRTVPENIKLEVIAEGDDCITHADPGRLQQVLMNLVLNARDAMPGGGELMLELTKHKLSKPKQLYFERLPPGFWLQLSVTDTGFGIPSEDQPHIFEPFYTTKPPGEGTGLGLAQVYGIVKQHQGYIDVHSEPGVKTEFSVFLRIEEGGTNLDRPRSVVPISEGEGEIILVVEDDDAIRTAIGDILDALNYEVLLASNGEEAIRYFESAENTPDLVLSDLIMPNVGGVELFDALRTKYPQLPMIVMTGYPLGEKTREFLRLNRVSWLQKPLGAEVISRKVKEELSQHRFRSE